MIGKLHILTDTHLQQRYSHYQLTEMAIAGGAEVIQYRNKNPLTGEDYTELSAIRALTLHHGVTFLINDYVEVAIACKADGVHVGIQDTDPVTARVQLIAGGIGTPVIGATVHSLEELHALPESGIDYIGCVPFLVQTQKKQGCPPWDWKN